MDIHDDWLVLVQFNSDWADEFDVYGLAILPYIKYQELLLWSKNCTWGFGTNEGWENEDLSSSFSILSADIDEINSTSVILPFQKYGSYMTVGHFPHPELPE